MHIIEPLLQNKEEIKYHELRNQTSADYNNCTKCIRKLLLLLLLLLFEQYKSKCVLYTTIYSEICVVRGVWKTNDIIPCRLGVKDYIGLAVHCRDRMLRRHVKTTEDSLPSYMDFITII